MSELTSTICKTKCKGPTGFDGIQPIFMKALDPIALGDLLEIFNPLFLYANCPRIWRVATIMPILKAHKPTSEVVSYQPITLPHVSLNFFIVAGRLCYMAESKHLSSHFQAGF